jgi:quinol monooxygenase YgiN
VFALIVRFDLRPKAVVAFDQLVGVTTARIRAEEPGTLLYLCHRVQDEPTARIFYELYRDREAFQIDEVQPHFKEFHAQRKALMAGPERVEFLDRLDGKGWPAD